MFPNFKFPALEFVILDKSITMPLVINFSYLYAQGLDKRFLIAHVRGGV